MKKHAVSRRDVSPAARRRSPQPRCSRRRRGLQPRRRVDHAGLDRGGRKEGKVVWYTSVDLPVAERIAKAFEAKYPGIAVRVERSGAERVFQRIGQEYGSPSTRSTSCNSSDAAHFIVWKRDGWLAPYVPEDVAKHYPAEHSDPDGHVRHLARLALRHRLQHQPGEARGGAQELADLLDPKWSGKIVKAHPGYSGTIMTATFQMARDLGWEYFEKLAKQTVMQVQSAADPPKKLALGERAVMADGNEYNMFQLKEKGEPVEIVYPTEGTPLIIGPNGVMKSAPEPERRALFQSFMLHARMPAAHGRLRRPALVPPQVVKEKPGRKPLQRDQADEGRSGGGGEAGRKEIEEIKVKRYPARAGIRSVTRGGLRGARLRGTDRSKWPQTSHRRTGRDARPARRPVRAGAWRCSRRVLCVLVVLPVSWLVVVRLHRPRGAASRSPLPGAVHRPGLRRPADHDVILAVRSVGHLLRGRGADGLAGGAHRPADGRRDPRAGDGLVRDAAVPRRDGVGDPGRAQQRAPQPSSIAWSPERPGRAPVQHLLAARPDLRHLLLHLPLRVRAGRQRARPHPRRPRGRLRHARRQRLDDGAARDDPAGAAGAARRRAGRLPAGDDPVRLAGHPGAAGRLPHHDDEDLEPVPVSAQARARRRRRAAAARAHGPAAARAQRILGRRGYSVVGGKGASRGSSGSAGCVWPALAFALVVLCLPGVPALLRAVQRGLLADRDDAGDAGQRHAAQRQFHVLRAVLDQARPEEHVPARQRPRPRSARCWRS